MEIINTTDLSMGTFKEGNMKRKVLGIIILAMTVCLCSCGADATGKKKRNDITRHTDGGDGAGG